MTTENFTWDNVIAAMRKAVETKGEDYVYPKRENAKDNCYYSNEDGTPSCIVGHVLAETTPEAYAQVARTEGRLKRSTPADRLFLGAAPGFLNYPIMSDSDRETELLRAALEEAQGLQDCGHPWGQAYDAFLAVLGLDREDVQ